MYTDVLVVEYVQVKELCFFVWGTAYGRGLVYSDVDGSYREHSLLCMAQAAGFLVKHDFYYLVYKNCSCTKMIPIHTRNR
jgi:hypothetical protein